MKKNHVWVIEEKDGDRWIPTPHILTVRGEARDVRNTIYNHDIDIKLRIRKYVSE